jgi:hypothetical protein
VSVWFWLVCTLGIGILVGIEAWAWMRHRASAVALVVTGTLSVGAALIAVLFALMVGYGIFSGVSGWDPVGLLAEEPTSQASSSASGAGSSCDSNYAGDCLDPDAADYDCLAGDGDGPRYTGPVEVVGSDPFDLDRDGDGYACE